jgi:hypothetical protein
MQRLCRITVPGLSVERDFTDARQRLLAEFPNIDEVIATTAPGTLLVLASGRADVDAWVDALIDSVTTRPAKGGGRLPRWRVRRLRGDDSAA